MIKKLMISVGMAAAAGAASAGVPQGRVLVVLSSETMLSLRDGAKYPTGYYFNELTVPVRKLVEAGYEVTFASPLGNPPVVDTHSLNASYFGGDKARFEDYKRFHDGLSALRRPLALAKVIHDGLDRFQAVFFPGGHAPMEDLLQDAQVGQILRYFHEKAKPTALICHGPISLLAAMARSKAYVQALADGKTDWAAALAKDWIYAGYRMTIFSTAEEQIAEEKQLGGKVRFYPDSALHAAGGDVQIAAPWNSNVVRDRELITGQNPYSDEHLADVLLQALSEKH